MSLEAPAASPIQVLVVDDSAVARQAVATAVREQPDMDVAGLASNGRSALEQLRHVTPDVIVLDLEMPEMDGMAFLAQMRSDRSRIPVIVFSALTSDGAAATLAAMAVGASAYALKPTALRGSSQGTISSELIPLIRAIGVAGRPIQSTPQPTHRLTDRPTGPRTRGRITAVAIGVSTGGPNALAELLPSLPPDLPVPVLVVQHMPKVFTRLLAERLDAAVGLHVVEAAHGNTVVPGTVYIAPGGRHMTVRTGVDGAEIALNDDPPENSCRPAVDVLFRSVPAVYGAGVLGVVLTGMGSDGTAGSAAIVAAGGEVIVQEPTTAVVGSMPASVLATGVTDVALTLSEIAAEIDRRSRGPFRS